MSFQWQTVDLYCDYKYKVMSEKRIRVNTSSSSSPHGYKLISGVNTYGIYYLRSVGIFSDDWDRIGEAKNVEDALVIIHIHASRFGIVRDIEFRD